MSHYHVKIIREDRRVNTECLSDTPGEALTPRISLQQESVTQWMMDAVIAMEPAIDCVLTGHTAGKITLRRYWLASPA